MRRENAASLETSTRKVSVSLHCQVLQVEYEAASVMASVLKSESVGGASLEVSAAHQPSASEPPQP